MRGCALLAARSLLPLCMGLQAGGEVLLGPAAAAGVAAPCGADGGLTPSIAPPMGSIWMGVAGRRLQPLHKKPRHSNEYGEIRGRVISSSYHEVV